MRSGHPVIVLRLELEQHEQKHPPSAQAQVPDGVAVAGAQFVADTLGRELAQAGEVRGGQPVSGQAGTQHILDQRGGEQTLVVLVVQHG